MKIVSGLMLIAALLASDPAVGAEKVSDRDRFELWNDCKAIDLLVSVYADAMDGDIAPTEKEVEAAVRRKLRIARLYNPNAAARLTVTVHVAGIAFTRDVEFVKRVRDVASGLTDFTATWRGGSVGSHGTLGSDARKIRRFLMGLARHVDEFLDEYLRVNASACSR